MKKTQITASIILLATALVAFLYLGFTASSNSNMAAHIFESLSASILDYVVGSLLLLGALAVFILVKFRHDTKTAVKIFLKIVSYLSAGILLIYILFRANVISLPMFCTKGSIDYLWDSSITSAPRNLPKPSIVCERNYLKYNRLMLLDWKNHLEWHKYKP